MKTRHGFAAALVLGLVVFSAGCSGQGAPVLKDAFEKDFTIGAALGLRQIDGADSIAAGLISQFNSITPENVLKWEPVHPEPLKYEFGPADRFVALGEKRGLFVVGHTLVWHSQTPKWVFEDGKGKPAGRDLLLGRMREHILAVAGRYKGRIKGWDVVNEALEDDGTLRKSAWLTIVGEDYIQKAFEFAREADPGAELYYNDYNLWKPAKAAGAVRIVETLRAAGVRVDGIGEQGHWSLKSPALAEADAAFRSFAGLGVKVMVTELDIGVLPNPWDLDGADVARRAEMQKGMNPYAEGLPDSVQAFLTERYRDVFGLFLKHRESITRVTFWGVHDGHSWLNGWPIRGRTNYPLLFDRQGKPKPAFDAVIRAAAAAKRGR